MYGTHFVINVPAGGLLAFQTLAVDGRAAELIAEGGFVLRTELI
jgi:hypothetical protein